MVAKITIGKSIAGVINYNEKKVKQDKAAFFHSDNMYLDTHKLTYQNKIDIFEDLISKRPKVQSNAVHIALAFDKSEHIDQFTLREISDKYLAGLGFNKQPYLVYQHFDADHPHIHIVTTNIVDEKKAIDLHGIGRELSEPVRKSIEQEFNLIVAEGRSTAKKERQRIPVEEYSKAGTKARISEIVRDISKTFAFASLAEYNTILNRYGVMADQGTDGSKIRENKGLVYRLLNEEGEMYGHSIKASAIFESPTLKNIEARFGKNKVRKVKGKGSVKSVIDSVFKAYNRIDRETFVRELTSKGIEPVFRTNKENITYGLQFIDHNTKSVYKASELGKTYSAAQLMARFGAFAISSAQEREAGRIMEAAYRQIKRDSPSYYFESTLLRDLPKLNLKLKLQQHFSGQSFELIDFMVYDFKERKREKLALTLQQEQLSFKDRATALLRFINVKPDIDLKTKLIFLLSNNVLVQQRGNDIILSDDRGKAVQVVIPGTTIAELFRTKDRSNYTLTEKDKIPFTLTERKLFANLGKGQPIPDDYRFASAYKVSFPRMERYTAKEMVPVLQSALTRNYLHEVLPKIDTTNAGRLMEELTNRGLLVKQNRVGELYIGYYRTANENFIKLPEQIASVLYKGGYNSQMERKLNDLVFLQNGTRVSTRYDMAVKIRQYGDQQKYRGIQQLVSNIESKNPQLYQLLHEASKRMFVATDPKDPDLAIKNKFDNLVTQIIFNVVVNYPSKNLSPKSNINHQYINNYIDGEVKKLTRSIKQHRDNKGRIL